MAYKYIESSDQSLGRFQGLGFRALRQIGFKGLGVPIRFRA